jgi:hypothetical protein
MNSSGAVVEIVGVLRWSSQLYMLGVRFDMVQQSVEKSRNEFKWCEMSFNCVWGVFIEGQEMKFEIFDNFFRFLGVQTIKNDY